MFVKNGMCGHTKMPVMEEIEKLMCKQGEEV